VLQRLVLGVILQALAGDSVPPLDPLPAVVVVGNVVAGVGQPVEVSLGGHVPPVHGQQHSVRTDAGRLAEKSPLCVSAPAGGERDGGPQGQAKSDASFHHGSPLSFLADSVETPRTGQAGDVPPPPSYAGHGKNMMKLTGSRPRPPPRPASGPPPGPGRPPAH
ncbi:Stage III sporulation protein AF, partial [Dysosmobacter welbionis]